MAGGGVIDGGGNTDGDVLDVFGEAELALLPGDRRLGQARFDLDRMAEGGRGLARPLEVAGIDGCERDGPQPARQGGGLPLPENGERRVIRIVAAHPLVAIAMADEQDLGDAGHADQKPPFDLPDRRFHGVLETLGHRPYL